MSHGQSSHSHDGESRDPAQVESPIDAQLAAPPSGPRIPDRADIPAAQPSDSWVESELIQSRAIVLGTLFLVTGVFGVPLLWINRKFSSTERIVWAIIVTIYTAFLFWIVYMVLMWSYRRIAGY